MKKIVLVLGVIGGLAAGGWALYSAAPMQPQPQGVETDCESTNPYKPENAPGCPQGPIYCPVPQEIDWDCVKKAQKKYEDDMATLYGLAYGWYDHACESFESEVEGIDKAYAACVDSGTPEEVCARRQNFSYKIALDVYASRLEGQQKSVSEWTDKIAMQYWEDVSKCCVEGDQ